MAEQNVPLHLVELQLCRIEWHHVNWNARCQQLTGTGDVLKDVPLGIWSMWLGVPQIISSQIHGTSHHDHSLELVKGLSVLVNHCPDVRARTDRDERDLPGILANEVKRRLAGIAPGWGRATLSITSL